MSDFDNNTETGDILLFKGKPKNMIGILDRIIRYFTKSEYIHIAMILKDPTYMGLKGIYVWESSWEGLPDPQDNKTKLGVQITPIKEILDNYRNMNEGEVYYRKINCNPELFSIDKI